MTKIILCLILLCTLVNHACANTATGSINVLDYGAKGDGITDDTEAIRKAVSAAAIRFSQPVTTSLYHQTGPVLVFPSGRYLISADIVVDCLEIRGEGRAIITQSNTDKDILRKEDVWRIKISNLSFVGGRNQIDLRNSNLDTGQIIIDHCRFHYSTGFGVYTSVQSTTVKINDCEFLFCNQAWYNGKSDQAIMSDTWITSDPAMDDKAVIEHRGGRLTLDNITGVPMTGRRRQRWIDNHGETLSARSFRFGGEGGGFTPVYNYRKYQQSSLGNSILIEDSLCCANSSYGANCVVYAHEVPNSIIIRDSQLVGCEPVIVDKKVDLRTYFENVSRDMLHYSVSGCTGENITRLPKGLTKPAIKKSATRMILSPAQTKSALAEAKEAVLSANDEPYTGGVSNGHTQQTDSEHYAELTDWSISGSMDATTQPNSDWLAIAKAGTNMLAVYRQNQPGGWPHITISAQVDLDKYPWLSWKQKKGTAPGAFAVKVIDAETGAMYPLYNETQTGEYDYYARNLKTEMKTGGSRKIEIRFYPLAQGWEYPSAKAGQYVVYDFMRMEAD